MRLASLTLALLLTPSLAFAQARLTSGGMDLRLLRPPLDSKGLLTLNGTDILGENALSFGLVLDAGFGLLPFDGFVDSAEILSESSPLLDTIARALNANPQIVFVEVQGHADDRGGDDYNIALTRDRAASVVTALQERGVDPARMRSAGYGWRCPAIPCHGDTARAANRRVEIKVLRDADGPTGVEVACRAGRELIPR